MKKLFSTKSNFNPNYHFKLDLKKLGQHIGGKWLIHGTKHRKDIQLQSPDSSAEYPQYMSNLLVCLVFLKISAPWFGRLICRW